MTGQSRLTWQLYSRKKEPLRRWPSAALPHPSNGAVAAVWVEWRYFERSFSYFNRGIMSFPGVAGLIRMQTLFREMLLRRTHPSSTSPWLIRWEALPSNALPRLWSAVWSASHRKISARWTICSRRIFSLANRFSLLPTDDNRQLFPRSRPALG
jgi:hypothetical protein